MQKGSPRRVFGPEAARLLRVSRQRVFQMALAGRLRAERVGERGVLVFRRDDLERLIAERTQRKAEATTPQNVTK